jgi:hypothetical protein
MYVKGAKHCLGCELFIITDSPICACCGSTLGYTIATPPEFRGYNKFRVENFSNG